MLKGAETLLGGAASYHRGHHYQSCPQRRRLPSWWHDQLGSDANSQIVPAANHPSNCRFCTGGFY
ncbi:hypothetical protein [Imperialibacter sp.]|uniref:hypothetical protein n=1 Tax=Imperialibacter sp. TaxID=2038411 RepID=UPI0032EBFBB4